jgi:hypothetical protein
MELEGTLLCSLEPITGTYPKTGISIQSFSVLHVTILQEIYPVMHTLSLPSKLHVQRVLSGYSVTTARCPIWKVTANIFGVGYKDANLHCKTKHLKRS